MRDVGVGEPAIDQDELEREEKTGADSGGERAIAAKKRNPVRARSERSKTVAMIERSAACMTCETSAAIHLIVTCWKPQSAVRSNMTAIAAASSARRS